MSAEQPFVHLHVHTEFSLLDGLSKIDKLVARAVELGMKSLAITDHGAMFGVVQFYRACMKAGIKPIIGMEGYLAKSDMHVHDQSERQPYHLLLLAKDQTGYKNLLKIASAAQLEGFYSRPRIDKDFLSAHHEGLICTTGCLAAQIPRMVADGREEEARREIGWYQDIFGKENFFLELQHHAIPELHALNRWLLENQRFADVPLLATNDVHYVLEDDFNAHDTLLCIQTGALKREAKRMKMTDASYHLRSQQEMWSLFGEIAPQALLNTVRVAEMCVVNLESKGYHLPTFPVPTGTPESYLRYLAERGLRWRYGDGADDEALRKRLNYELDIIHQMGFDTYFLIVWDLCQFAHTADIWWNVRGSGAGSVTAYSLGITSIDPIENGLIFERFLNPGRVSMPDIDMDFPDDRRMEMIDYAMRKYGSDKVAAIITFGTMKARAAIKDVGRALDYPLPSVNNLTKLIPQIPSKPVTLTDCLSDNPEKAVPELKKMYAEDGSIKILLDTAKTVEGVARNAGTHAAGVIIGDKPLVEYLPLHRPIGDTKVKQVTQFPMEICESIGLLKVDFLGLSTLTIMRKACDLIQQQHGVRLNMSNIPYRPDPDDPEKTERVEKAFRLIGEGETTGVFQLESAGMIRMLKDMKPTSFEHIIAAISLYRPGPMELIPTYIARMHGREEVQYHHPKLEAILKETFAVIVYQEQIQQIAAQLFGYSLGDADLMRRAVSKKKLKDLMTHKQTFMEKGPENGVPAEVAEKIFGEIEYFAAYGFNKCLTYDTEIVDAVTGRLIRIGDLAEGKAHLDQTLTCDTDRLKISAGQVTEVHENGVKPVFRLTTRLGRQIEATANHPFYTPEGWRLLYQLEAGDKVAVLKHPHAEAVEGTKSWPEEKVIALGKSLAKGRRSVPDEVFELKNEQISLMLTVFRERGHKWQEDRWFAADYRVVPNCVAPKLQQLYSRVGILTRISTIPARFRALPHQVPVALEILDADDPDIEGDIYWDTVESIQRTGEQPTYDLTVPGTHNFVANDFIVHNSHAADYAVLTCQTAYLKAHYPEEYYTALLTVQRNVIEDVRLFTADCRRFNIPILPPNINRSGLDFTIEVVETPEATELPPDQKPKRGIRYGLGAVKNAGEKAIQQIIDARDTAGPFVDLSDLCRRVDLRKVGSRALESLVKVGAFDDFAGRDELLASLERLTRFSSDYHKAADVGQMSLFGGSDAAAGDTLTLASVPPDKVTPRREQLRWEKDLVGLYVSEHPLQAKINEINHLSNIHYSETLRRESEQMNGRPVTIAGIVVNVRTIVTKKGDTMAIVSVEDVEGNIDCVLFPRTWTQYGKLIAPEQLVIIRGTADASRGDMQVITESVAQDFVYLTSVGDEDEADPWFDPPPVQTHNSAPALPPRANGNGSTATPTLAPRASAVATLESDISEEDALDSREPDDFDAPYQPDTEIANSAEVSTSLEPSAASDPFVAPSVEQSPAGSPEIEAATIDDDDGDADQPESEPRRITITIQRTENADKDRRRILRIKEKLNSYPGRDQFRFRVVDAAKIFVIDFPNHSTAYSAVEGFLLEQVGRGAIQVEPLTES